MSITPLRSRLAASLLVAGLSGLLGSCTEANLKPLEDEVDKTDDKLAVTGQVCTSPPDEVTFPVKLMLVVDQSASLQCTDPGNVRLSALAAAGTQLDALPNVEFGVVGFASWSRITEFTPDWGTANAALAPANGAGGPATDYQGALSTALTVLEQDMLEAGPAEVARTRYVVVFMSDGAPEPRCRAGCNDGSDPPDSLYGVCNTSATIDPGDYTDFGGACPEYNQENQILQKVRDIVSLADFHGAGDLTLSTVLLFADDADVAAVCGDVSIFGYDKSAAEPLLIQMAQAGGGTYRDVNTSGEVDFLDYDFQSLDAPWEVAEFFAVNRSSIPIEGGVRANDSDGDGLDDDLEFDLGLERLAVDTDGDGFSDLLERIYSSQGFDATDPLVPSSGCASKNDRDGDGLRACEEAFLGTDDLLADTDDDRIPDGVELRYGTEPTLHDVQVDHDLDGRVSGLEVRVGTHPQLFDEEEALLDQVRYSVSEVDPLGGSKCYDFELEGITLVPALNEEQDQKGRNEVLFFAQEEPAGLRGARGRYHVACVEARYLGEAFKDPADGRITDLSPYRFVEMPSFDAETHCLKVGEDPTLRPEWSWE